MATVGLVLFALGPGAATAAADGAGNDALDDSLDVSVSQAGNAGPVVTVTDNDTAVENATVTVEALDNGTYAAVGEDYATDANGTVTLPEPEENVSVEVTATAGDATGSTTADLTVAGDSEDGSANFGLRVSSFVDSLLSGNATAIGQQVAQFVTEHNPGNAPPWAGPPADDDDKRGPPAHAGQDDDNETDDRRGPPAHAGQDDDNETDDRRGPPAHAGQDDDSEETNETAEDSEETNETAEDSEETNETAEDSEETNETAEDSEESDDAEDDSNGPPAHARGGGN
ncbi:hypothetical protein [Haloarcula onubensis]|uniref:DNA primase n=1 Tax=Haloarcula onubensis TaxID=2950539 RepID=A0ABU2FNL3_9EURY|nr:hypothetical protein [Halomicroarcula sp. S3CR25-11]MDS0281842.1 hypothetical protein [Halomicroarcula sp. S3CR25-11]